MPSPLAAGWEQLASNYRTSILEFLALSFTERSGVGGGGEGGGGGGNVARIGLRWSNEIIQIVSFEYFGGNLNLIQFMERETCTFTLSPSQPHPPTRPPSSRMGSNSQMSRAG